MIFLCLGGLFCFDFWCRNFRLKLQQNLDYLEGTYLENILVIYLVNFVLQKLK